MAGFVIDEMIYRFINDKASFVVKDPHRYNLYFPLTDAKARLLSSISPNLSGDIKQDNEHFLTPPASVLDLKNNPLCCRDFFIRSGNEVIRLSKAYDDTLEAGILYHKISKKTGKFAVEALNFIPHDTGVEVMRVRIRNVSRITLEIIPTSFIPLYGRSEKNLRDHRHVSSLLNRLKLEKRGIILEPTMVFDEKGHRLNNTKYFVLGYEGKGRPFSGQFPSMEYFFGEGDILKPDAIVKEVPPVRSGSAEFDGKESCAAFRFAKKSLAPGETAEYFLIMGINGSAREIDRDWRKLNAPEKVREAFEKTCQYWQDYLSGLSFDFRDPHLNNWLSWVKLQPALRKLFGCSFLPHFDYGKGGRGWRDLWQDGLSLMLTEPEKAKELILNSFRGVRLDGSNATIITGNGDFIADRNKISRVWMDHGVWPYLTTRFYINKSGDIDFLLKDQFYFRDHQLSRAKEIDTRFSQRDFIQRCRNNKVYRGTILEHLLVQNLVQFFNVGSHNIIKLENADWNDGLDMAPDKGESVVFSFMYCHNLKNICVFLEALKKKQKSVFVLKELVLLLDSISRPVAYNDFRQKQKRLAEYLGKVKVISGDKIEINIDDLIVDLNKKSGHLFFWLSGKEWLTEGFFNGYYDNKGLRVEGKKARGLRMMLASQVFAIMSGVADNRQVKKAWGAINRNLKDKRLKGFRLNTDFGSCYMDLGRAFGFSYGDKENGAFFSHMNVMLANALYKRGFIREGFTVLDSIYRMALDERSGIYPVLPEYFNGQGKGLYLYLTGSASWYVYTLAEELLGIKFVLGDILIDPKLMSDNFRGMDIQAGFRLWGKKVRIVYIKTAKVSRPLAVRKVLLGDKNIFPGACGYLIKKSLLAARENIIKVYLG